MNTTYRPSDLAAVTQAKWSTGVAKIDGRHIAVDGLVARSGRRRILPGGNDDDWLLELYAEQLAALAGRVLHGRSATVFQGRILNPLMGLPQIAVESLAAQFAVSTVEIYKILDRAKLKLKVAAMNDKSPREAPPIYESCPTCGRQYNNSSLSWAPCKRGYSYSAQFNRKAVVHPECWPPSYRAMKLKKLSAVG